ncbi:uncharacterized protein LOC144430357 [Styela clava]
MKFVKIIFFISLICVFRAKIKVPAGSCVSKIVNGKLVQVGDCKKNDGSEIARLIKKSLDEKKKTESDDEDKCGFKYDSKCYRAVVYATYNVTLDVAEPTCKSMKIGKPANIYDLAHYKLLIPYLRSLIPSGRTWSYIWTGMEYKKNQLLQSNGVPITIASEVWQHGDPHTDASDIYVGVRVVKDPESKYQGMFNRTPDLRTHGVVCEI